MILKLLLDLSMIVPFIIFPFFWGYDDGYMKRKYTEAHWPKFLMFACIGFLSLFEFDALTLLYWGIIWKPLFDIGWSIGAGYNYIFIGTTFFLDNWMHKLGVVRIEKEKFPIITLIYFISIFIGGMAGCNYKTLQKDRNNGASFSVDVKKVFIKDDIVCPASKKNLIELFPDEKSTIENLIKKNKIKFKRDKDLLLLLQLF